jgi:membrane-bound lytic murein transglycosylase D
MTTVARSFITAVLLLTISLPGQPRADDLFPMPAELERDVDFWLRVFSDVSTDEGLLHDNRNLAVVYERMPMPAATGRRERNRRVAQRRRHYQAILKTLAAGKRSGLGAEEQRVLELWGDEASSETFAQAERRIRFQHGLSDRFADSLRRAGRWRGHINSSLQRYGVPTELAALPHVESSYNPEARSHVGASGIWQFTRSTGRRFMQVDHIVDARNDPWFASEAAAQLLAYNYSLTNNWPMAITAYNHGLAGARRAMRQFGDTAYAEILRNYKGRTFGFASRNFYVAFLAAREIDQNPDKYFPGVRPESPIDYATFQLDDYVPAEALVATLGISQEEFAAHNPSLQATIWQGSKHVPRGLPLRVPRGRVNGSPEALLASLGADQRYAEQLPDLFHTIARGDTLSEIADAYDTSVSTLVALNGLGSRHRIRAGQRLRLPAAGPAPEVVAAAAEPAAAPEREPPVEVLADVPAIAPPAEAGEEAGEGILGEPVVDTLMGALQSALLSDPSDYTIADDLTIEVQPLETLGHYADWLGIRTQRLRDINGLAFRTPVVVGQRIRLDIGPSNVDEFERRRSAYHKQQQDSFFRRNTITGVQEHVVRNGESLWVLAHRRYDVPVWLFRQYNPGVDLHRVRAGTRVRFPTLESHSG